MTRRKNFRSATLLATLLLWLAAGLGAQQPAKQHDAPPKKSVPAPAASKAPAAAAESLDVPWVTRKLSNGMEIIVYPDRSVPLVTADLALKMGSFVESDDTNGFSHFYEHLFFRENAAIASREDYLDDIGRKGIIYNGETREEVTHFYFTALSVHLDTMLRFLRDASRYPTFNPGQFEREREVVIDEILRQDANPYSALEREVHRRLHPGQAARKLPGGTQRSLRGATIARMREWHRKFVAPDNAALIVTGDVEPADVFRRATELFGDWKRADNSPPAPPPPLPPLERSVGSVVEAPVQNVVLRIDWHGPSVGVDTPATHAADVFSNIVRQPASRFQRALVDSGLVTAVNVNYYTQHYSGPISILAITTPDKIRAARQAIFAEVARWSDPAYFTDQELENAKASLAAADLFDQEKLSEYAHTLGFWWASGGTDYFRDYQGALRRVTRGDIRRYLSTYVLGKPFSVVVLLSPQAQRQLQLNPEELVQP